MGFVPHAGERAVRERTGEADVAARVSRMITPDVPAVAAAFLADRPMLVLGARDDEGDVWCTLLTGTPGFVRAVDPRAVAIAASPTVGDPLEPVLARSGTPVGLLAIEPETRRRMRINGRSRSDGDGLVVETDEVYANCPKYISRRAVVGADGTRGEVGAPVAGSALTAGDRALITSADAFFIASAHPEAGVDASHRGGRPGFVTVRDDRSLSFPDYTGNTLYMTLGNITADPHVGLVFPDWYSGDLLLLSGTAEIDWSADRAAAHPGAHRVVDVRIGRTVRLPGASPLRWGPAELSRFDP